MSPSPSVLVFNCEYIIKRPLFNIILNMLLTITVWSTLSVSKLEDIRMLNIVCLDYLTFK